MTPRIDRIERFDPKTATPEQWRAYHDFADARRAEELPDDPPMPRDVRERLMTIYPAEYHPHHWLAWRDGRVIGEGYFGYSVQETNQHLCEIHLSVVPDARRQGMAAVLLEAPLQAALAAEKTHAVTWSNDRVPGGEAFLTRLGLQANLRQLVSQLALAEADTELLSSWVERKEERAAHFEVTVIEGMLPDDRLHEFAGLFDVMNTAPRGTLEVEDEKTTPEQLREREQSFAKTGRRRLTAVVTERATGELAGFSMLVWMPETASVVQQWGTGVWPKHRDRGLGRVLKAANLLRLLEVNPEARFVRTSNAHVNAAMLGINRAMGFKPYMEEAAWQTTLERLEAYLSEKTGKTEKQALTAR